MKHKDRCAPDCDDQLPSFSLVGRGPKGNSVDLEISYDSDNKTILHCTEKDSETGNLVSEWLSENINGGKLEYQYNLNPHTDPRTFTITFKYTRPGRPQWHWVTPAIPYIWTVDKDGNKQGDPDHIVGSGVATIFLSKDGTNWQEYLEYPKGWNRNDFNAPEQGDAWTANIVYGKDGLGLPDFDDLAKIIGITKNDLFNILEGNSVTINGISAKNLIEYIDKCDARDLDHLHNDLGFDTPLLNPHHTGNAFGVSPITDQSYSSVKDYIDGSDLALKDYADDVKDDLMDYIDNLYGIINDLVNHIFGAALVTPVSATDIPSVSVPKNSGKKINWNKNNWQSGANITYKIPQGNINVLSPDWGKAILTHSDFDGAAGDVKTNA